MTSRQLTDLALIAADRCRAVIAVISLGSSAAQIWRGREAAKAPDKPERRNVRLFSVVFIAMSSHQKSKDAANPSEDYS